MKKNQLGFSLYSIIQYQKTMTQVCKMLRQSLSETHRHHTQSTTFSKKKRQQAALSEYSIQRTLYEIQPTKRKMKFKKPGTR